jgi:hypothetical protein
MHHHHPILWIQMNFYTNPSGLNAESFLAGSALTNKESTFSSDITASPDGPTNHTGSNIGALYKAMPKPIKVKITANDRKAWSCIRNFKHTYLVNSSMSTSDLWNFRFYSPSSKDNDLQTPGWNLSCVYFQ